MRKRPRIQTLLLLVNLAILLLPLFGIWAFRLYESEVIRQTEASLIGQGALVAGMFRQELARQFARAYEAGEAYDLAYGTPLDPRFRLRTKGVPESVPPRLDIAEDEILPPGRSAAKPNLPPDAFAAAAGEAILPAILSSKDITFTGTRVVDFRGTVVASSGTEQGMSLLTREEVPRALAGDHVSLLRKRQDPPLVGRGKRVRVFVAIPVIDGDRVWGAVVLSRTPLDMYKALYLIRWHIINAGLFILLLVIAMTALTTILIGRPVKALMRQAEDVASGKETLAAPLKKPGTREVEQLSQAISKMARTLSARALHIRAFADSVSHGFKTPLTSLTATVEILRDPEVPVSHEERERFLEIMDSEISRLNRLVKKLIALSRADVIRPGDQSSDARRVADDLVRSFKKRGRKVSARHSGEYSTVAMAYDMLEQVLVNLVENSWQHGGEDVEVAIATSSSFGEGSQEVVLTVQDSGPGVPEGDAEKIFTPFYTTAKKKGGSGMGLSIVRTLVEAHGGSVSLEPSQKGALFRVTLPYAPLALETAKGKNPD